MKITLRKANALQNAIQEQIKTIDISLSVALNEFQDVALQVEKARATVMGSDQRRANLTMALYAIRGLVGTANATSGVSEQLARAAYLDKRIGHLKGLSEADATDSLEVVNGKLDKIRNSKSENSRLYGYNDTVATGVLTQAQIDQFKADLSALKKEKQSINDKVLELNIRTEIELIDEVVQILQAEQLV